MRAIRGMVMGELGRWRPSLIEALEAHEGREAAEAICDEAASRLDAMLDSIPDPGWTAPHMRAFTIGGAIYVATYLALAPRGYDAARAWEICESATRARGCAGWSAAWRRTVSSSGR
ncbi:hypothetical protein [Sandaracinus amylolyticus]|uniref:hypothetical protein n=1 Tax=Sandaracinus amylolyticus TaxID=927083 RepID=UPI001F187EF5|nr:hypothetical protein [Sandaracinus amylolyticus]